MTQSRSKRAFWMTVVTVLMATTPAAAQDKAIDAFFGQYIGTGAEAEPKGANVRVSERDFDVDIAKDGDGFVVTWTTIARAGSAEAPKIKRKTNKVSFFPSGRPGVYAARPQGDAVAGEPYTWARIEGETLKVYSITLNEAGAYEIQQYDRTLAEGGMTLEFKRIREGEVVRVVRGRLIK